MKTYLKIFFSSEGVSPSEVKTQLMNMGFKATKGNYDFVYDWKGKKPSKGEILSLGDKVVKALEGSGAIFNLDTHD